jgi:hypothetical protein
MTIHSRFAVAAALLVVSALYPIPAAADQIVSALVLKESRQQACLDINLSNDTLVLWRCHGGENQNFFTRAYGQQRYTKRWPNGDRVDMCLDQASSAEGAQLVMRVCDPNRPSQRWVLDQGASGFGLLRNEWGWCADIPRGEANEGTGIIVYTCHEGANQSWRYLSGQTASPQPKPAPGPGAGCSRSEITRAVREVTGRAVNGSGDAGECNPQRYGGQWSSYRDLLNKVAVNLTQKGAAYVFIAPRMALLQGHVGWAYINDDGTYSYGATDASKAFLGVIPPGVDSNEPWRGTARTEAEVFQAFKAHYTTDTYNEVKHTFVAKRNQSQADHLSREIRNWGYTLPGNNCVDHTYKVLAAYGAQEGQVLRSLQTRPAPNSWLRGMGKMNLDGSITPAKNENEPGERL